MIGFYIHILMIGLFVVPLIRKNTTKDLLIVWGLYFSSSILAAFIDSKSIIGFGAKDEYNGVIFIVYASLVIYSLSPLYLINKYKKGSNIKFYKFSKWSKIILIIIIIGGLFSIIYS